MSNRYFLILSSLCLAVTAQPAMALAKPSSQPFKVTPSPVFQSVHHQALTQILEQVAQRSGIVFKIDTDLANDRVERSISAANWQETIQKLLTNLNYTMIEEHGKIKSVIISGHKNDGIADRPTPNGKTAEPRMLLERKQYQLPEQYQQFPPGSVTPIKLPIDDIMNTPKKSSVDIELPVGKFNVTHDDTVDEPDGSKTWIGHLADEGDGYRVFLSQGPAGIMGVITTPDTKYSIEPTPEGGTYLLDTSLLVHGGYEADTRRRTH